MIAYCPLEELEPPVQRQDYVAVKKVETESTSITGVEETECNYVVMAFIVGVVLLAVSDSIRA
jgi:hypothetical protein